MVAFHFLRGDGTRWECDDCRKQGLEMRRRCGFLPETQQGVRRIVWARGRAVAEECPKSLVSADSIELLEKFYTARALGSGGWPDPTAREADAFLTLEAELRAEVENGR